MVEGAPTLVAAGIPPERAVEPSRRFFWLKRLRRDERGVAIVEFAIVLIPLFFIVFGILDFGRALQYYNDLTQIAGQGARAAAVNQNPNGGPATSAFQNQLACAATQGELRTGVRISVAYNTDPVNVGDPVTVTAAYDLNFLPFLGARMGWTKIALTASQTERYESGQANGFKSANDVSNGGSGC